MNKDEQLRRLLRLKRHEQPEEGYFEKFLDDFHAHQLKSLATQSTASLWWERVQTALSALRRPAVAWGAVAAYAGIMLLVHVWPAPDHANKLPVVIVSPNANVPAGAGTPQVPPGLNNWPNSAIPVGQTMQASDKPAAEVPGRRRTADQPQDNKDLKAPLQPQRTD